MFVTVNKLGYIQIQRRTGQNVATTFNIDIN